MSKQFNFKLFSLAYKKYHFKQFSLGLVRSFNLKKVIFQAIQFSISTCLPVKAVVFQAIQFRTVLVLFDLQIGPYQVLPLQVRGDLE